MFWTLSGANMSLLNLNDFHKYCMAVAGRTGLSLVWGERGSVPSTDGKRIYCPTPLFGAGDEELLETKTSLTHEAAHVEYTDFTLPKTEVVRLDGTLGKLWNLFEDGRIEDLSSAQWVGDKQLFQASDVKHLSRLVDVAMEGSMPPAIAAAWTVYAMHKMADNPALSAIVDRMVSEMQGEGEYNRLLTVALKNNILEEYAVACSIHNRNEGSLATLNVARKFFNEMDEKDKQEGTDGKGKGKGDEGEQGAGEGEGCSSEKSTDDAAASPKTVSGDTEGGATEKEVAEKGDDKGRIVVKWSDILKSDHTKEAGGGGTHITIEYDEDGNEKDYNPRSLSEYVVHAPDESMVSKRTAKACALAKAHAGFSNRVRAQLQIATRSRWQFGQKKGKLHNGALHRVTVPDSGRYGECVFKTKTQQNDLDVAVFVLLDMSGSMSSREKIEHGLAAAAVLSDSLGNALNLPVEIAGFTEICAPEIFRLRDFHEKSLTTERLCARGGLGISKMSENTDGEALLYAYHRISQRREKRKLIITLSDGMPAGGYGRGDIAGFTKEVVKQIQKSPVEIVGVGILDDSVKHFYKDHVIINDVDGLEDALLSVVKSRIIGA